MPEYHWGDNLQKSTKGYLLHQIRIKFKHKAIKLIPKIRKKSD